MQAALSRISKLNLGAYRKLTPLGRREARWGWLFLSPWLLGFVAFTLIPMVATIIFSFANLKIGDGVLKPFKLNGIENYKVLFNDRSVWQAMGNTLKFGAMALPVGIFVPFGVALLMNNKSLRGKFLFRTLFYMPFIIPFVSSIFLWGGMLNPSFGWVNKFLVAIGIQHPPQWAESVQWVYPTYIIMGIWGIGNAMLTMLASLQSVPTELYDAAKVDGAGPVSTLINVTWPMITPVIFYNLVLSIVGLFQYFLVPLVVNQGTGRPGGATYFYNLILYKTFTTYGNLSLGSAMAWVLFIVILLVTIILFGTAKYWVYYAGDSR